MPVRLALFVVFVLFVLPAQDAILMDVAATVILTGAIFSIAALYSVVGHAGASGYIACLALGGLTPALIKPTALALNLFVASIASYKFVRAGCFKWNLFWPFALTSIPLSFIGGSMSLPTPIYKQVVGCVLLFCAVRLFSSAASAGDLNLRSLPRLKACFCGAVIGLLSGLTGVGGGIFLSPLLLFAGWADARSASGVSAVFILVNSAAGLLGLLSSVATIPSDIVLWIPAAFLGGTIGAEVGSRRLPGVAIRRFLSLVLVLAGAKMLLIQ